MSMLSSFFDAPKAPVAGQQWTKIQRDQLLKPLTNQTGADMQSMFQQGSNPYAYQGPYSPGPSQLQQQYWQMAPQMAQQQMQGLQGIAGSQAPMDAMYNYGKRFAQDVITPQVMERFGGMGTADSGGALPGLARELGTYGMGLNSQIGQMGLQNQGQQLQAYNMMGQIPGQMAQAGANQYGVAMDQIQGNMQGAQLQDPYRSAQVQNAMTLLGFQIAPQGTPGGLGYQALGNAVGGMVQAPFEMAGNFLGMGGIM